MTGFGRLLSDACLGAAPAKSLSSRFVQQTLLWLTRMKHSTQEAESKELQGEGFY